MKKILFFAFCSACMAIANGQVDFGVKAGMNLSSFGGADSEDAKVKLGTHVGGLVQLSLGKMFKIQPELVYSKQGTKYDDFKVTLNYWNVPVLLKFVFRDGTVLETGPQFGYLSKALAKVEGSSINVTDVFNDKDFSWTIGIGFQDDECGVDARYNLGLKKLGKGMDTHEYNSVIQLGFYWFF